MSENKNVDNPLERGQLDPSEANIAVSRSEVSSVTGSVKPTKHRVSSSSERQIKYERAQKALENAALVSKRIKEHRKATAELLGRPFEDDDPGDTASEMASTMSERTGYSVATDTSTSLSVQDALNIPGISESLANTLKQKELLMERIKQYKEISKRPIQKPLPVTKEKTIEIKSDLKKSTDSSEIALLHKKVKEKDNNLSVLQVKIKAMETSIFDLQEKINEKDQIIEAKNKATTLISDSLSKKEKDSLILLDDTKQQMIKMQENFITMETEWKEEKQRLMSEIQLKDDKIKHLEEANNILESSRFEISVTHSKIAEELDLKNQEILELQQKLQNMSLETREHVKDDEIENVTIEKGAKEISDMNELTKKIELLEQLNFQIRQTNKELEDKLANVGVESMSSSSSPSKKASPLPSRKGSRNKSKQRSPWSNLSTEPSPQETEKKPNKNEMTKLEMLVQSLNKDILEKEYTISQKDALINELKVCNESKDATINELQQNVQTTQQTTYVAEIGVCTDMQITTSEDRLPDSHELLEKLTAAEQQIVSLNNEIEAANKSMIKVKSNQKLKLKQMQKTIDNFSKVSDSNAELVRLNEEVHQLSQKVAELEEEKGNLQLHLVDYDSGRMTDSDVYKKMIEMENLADARLKAISILETQKFDLVQELHVIQQKNADMEDKLADMSQLQSEQVCSEMKSVQLEEQIDELIASKKELELVIENLKLDIDQLNNTIMSLTQEKDAINQKLEHYIQESVELTDKLEKLSAEKVSSAESIEIVESLTTQEKLELEEYNKRISESKLEIPHEKLKETIPAECNESIEKLVEESAELNKKIELFTLERQEVLEKMNTIISENMTLQQKIDDYENQTIDLYNKIENLNHEKQDYMSLNSELSNQIEELKRERIDIMKESVEMSKPASLEDAIEVISAEVQEEKLVSDKGNKGAKSVKQLTKEILKLKNTIKEREAEIGDCQMKILSLQEQEQKQNEIIQNNLLQDRNIEIFVEENKRLKEELDSIKSKQLGQEVEQMTLNNDSLKRELQNLQQEYQATIISRDTKIGDLESMLLEYEKQVLNYSNSLQQKDKEMAEYINQITKLNDVSQKLKSTIEHLEEEKLKDPNAELVKSLNKQILSYQKKVTEMEERLLILEDDKEKLRSMKITLENQNLNLDKELCKLKDSLAEKQTLVKELQTQKTRQTEELTEIVQLSKERDEEIHEIKLQLRKESIENEKLRNTISQSNNNKEESNRRLEDALGKVNELTLERDKALEDLNAIDLKNKEMLEKLKKFAATIKKKSSMYIELENQLTETRKTLESKNEQIEQLLLQVETLPSLHEKLQLAEEELNRLHLQRQTIEKQKSQDTNLLQDEIKSLNEKLMEACHEISKLNDQLQIADKESRSLRETNSIINEQLKVSNNKLVDLEIELKNSMNYNTKIASLETENNQKHNQIGELLLSIENLETQINGITAKLQERDLYIESIEVDLNKYRSRIGRLEESVSIMEERRHSIEREADQLDSQLQEKQKAYSDYVSQEDDLVSRLAVLMDHDRVIEKQLHEIENENKEIRQSNQQLLEQNDHLEKSLCDLQDQYNLISAKAFEADKAETENSKYQIQIKEIENNYNKLSAEYQTTILQKKQDIETLEIEFNTQIENAIKEKNNLKKQNEKLLERLSQIERDLSDYVTNNRNLTINIEELTRINNDLVERSAMNIKAPDYTEQYISEINRLNSELNSRNEEVLKLRSEIDGLKNTHAIAVSNLEKCLEDYKSKIETISYQAETLNVHLNSEKQINTQLKLSLQEKEQEFTQLQEKSRVSFEMNIPKTEGMVISSTIEPLKVEPKSQVDLASLQTQIISDVPDFSTHRDEQYVHTHIEEQKQKASSSAVEPLIVPKTTYLCYKEDTSSVLPDPFNSDDGWGLGDSEETVQVNVLSCVSELNKQILMLKEENAALKAEFEASNSKLLRAVKKIKELKISNEMLSNDLKLSKQMSQSSFLETAIEDELKNNIRDLEKQVEDLNSNLSKESKEKDALRKQNEVFHNANEKLTEMKEKLDNEIELWKYKFKEANDKMSTLQWEEDSQDSPRRLPRSSSSATSNEREKQYKEDIEKLEKENEELQNYIDSLNSQNKELYSKINHLQTEIASLKQSIIQKPISCPSCESLKDELLEIQRKFDCLSEELTSSKKCLNDMESQKCEIEQKYQLLQSENNNLVLEIQNLNVKKCEVEDELQELISLKSNLNESISFLKNELDTANSKIISLEEKQTLGNEEIAEALALSDKNRSLEKNSDLLNKKLEEANNIINILENEKSDISHKFAETKGQVEDLNIKLKNLNVENDQLLSSVAELRSSISAAVDQRGFEIAELWKQHLAQREADFCNIEQELKNNLIASETKYEQLLESVQASNQDEANKLVVSEQLSSLQNKLQEKEDALVNLQSKFADSINQLELLRSEMKDEKVMHESSLLTQQEDYEKLIKNQTSKLEESKIDSEELNSLQAELSNSKSENDELMQQIQYLQSVVEDAETRYNEIVSQIQIKDSEIYQKTREYTSALAHRNEEFESVRKQLIEFEKKVEDLTYEKESELAVLRLKMHDQGEYVDKMHKEFEKEKTILTDELKAKILECTNLNKKITDLNQILEEHSSKTSEMQMALENQELEIVTLKDDIQNLQETLRSSSRIEKHVTFASDTKPGSFEERLEESGINKELLDVVPRAELDLALYMLHQRDVRCEELTMELTQLLEERDTLQLRLSDSIRSFEELKATCVSAGLDVSISSAQAVSDVPSFSIEREQQFVSTHGAQSSRSSSISDPDGDKPKLQAKLSELRTVRQSRDVRFRQESEQRQLDLRLLQRDVANLPPEAVDQLAQARHTFSRDSQSTSTVLLNWLRGKSTPKVVHM